MTLQQLVHCVRWGAICAGLSIAGFAWAQPSATETQKTPPHVSKPAPVGGGRTAARLQARAPDLKWDEMRLEDALERVARLADVNLYVRWPQLEAAGVTRDALVSVQTHKLTYAQVLWMIFNQVDSADNRLAFEADSDLIVISTEVALAGELVIQVYDVHDLLLITTPARSSGLTAADAPNPSSSGWPGRARLREVGRMRGSRIGPFRPIGGAGWGQGAPIGGGCRGGICGVPSTTAAPAGDPRAVALERLTTLITESVEPASWQVNGGRGTIHFWDGKLIIRNSPAVHAQLVGLGSADVGR